MLKKPHYIALILFPVLVLLLLRLPGETTARVKLAVSSFFLPLFGLSSGAGRVGEATGDFVLPRSEIVRQNAELRRENAELRLLTRQNTELLAENERLRQLAGMRPKLPWKARAGRVVARDPANWWHTLQINLGTEDGIGPNFPVLSPDGLLVGKVTLAGASRSQVTLLGDPKLRVAALIEETRDQGVVGPAGGAAFGSDFVELGYLSRNSSLKPGQRVITSGEGGLFPKGIVIGRVVDSRSVNHGLSVEARVKLAADFGKLEEVWVLLP